ncbi:YrdB family protein [Allorhizocola rhizosphaerae]|uniref:YrdB family protein n=1 Tax=Allorhizocola rhizosphaerae TaxID=1872709 RepID=UPI001B8ACF32|nr:YrdB family protein [Allorhizocola rhizosphaerae]
MKLDAVPRWFVYLNALLRFALEITALVVLAVWGWRISVVLATVLPLTAALLWARFVAPKAKWFLPLPGRLAVEAVVFGGATAALVDMGRVGWAILLGGLAVANSTLVHLVRDDERARLMA